LKDDAPTASTAANESSILEAKWEKRVVPERKKKATADAQTAATAFPHSIEATQQQTATVSSPAASSPSAPVVSFAEVPPAPAAPSVASSSYVAASVSLGGVIAATPAQQNQHDKNTNSNNSNSNNSNHKNSNNNDENNTAPNNEQSGRGAFSRADLPIGIAARTSNGASQATFATLIC
jgi:hypothetical protein